MGEPASGTPPPVRPPEDLLDSWKEIATYLNRDVTTVQRWEKREGMPVHRHLHDKAGSVYASRRELDSWARTRNLPAVSETGGTTVPPVALEAPRDAALRGSSSKWKLSLALAVAAAAVALILWLRSTEYFWRNPIANARFQMVTDFDGVQQDASISRDGRLVAFLSDRDGGMDVWLTQVGSGEFHNLTHGTTPELVNPSVRTLGFSPDGSLVTFWVRRAHSSGGGDIGIWALPVLGGDARPYLDGVAEFAWSRDASLLAYHTPGPGDPLYVSEGNRRPDAKPIFTAPAGLHSHFPVWSPDMAFIYFVQGSLPDKLDIWRIGARGGAPTQVTTQFARVSHPVFLDPRTLLYLATDPDGSGPWLYGMDVSRRFPHRVSTGADRYTSLAASDDGHRLVLTVASPKRTLWRLRLDDSRSAPAVPTRVPLTTSTGFAPRLGPDYLLYAFETGGGANIWKAKNGSGRQLWTAPDARILGGPAISPDGRAIVFSVREHGKSLLYAMQSDGTAPRVLTDVLDLQGAPAWSRDGQSITSAANDHGVPHLFRVPINGGPPVSFVPEFSLDPAWSPDGRFVVYSGPDVGTTFAVNAVTADAAPRPLPPLTLTRGARHLVFLAGGHALVVLRGEIRHKNLWLIDLQSGVERQLTDLAPDFDVRDFDISADGQDVILERYREESDIVLLERPQT